jgi:glycerophosphoryl diester phosphodiesterase
MHIRHLSIATCLGLVWMLQACVPTEFRSDHNLLQGEIMTVVHGCGGFETLRNSTPPNTVVAAQRSIFEGADAIEMDVQLSTDDQLIVFHDGRLDVTTDCSGCIADLPASAILPCRYMTRNGDLDGIHRLPLLDTLLSAIAATGTQARIFLNTKHDGPCDKGQAGHLDFATQLVACIRRHEMTERVIVESLDANFLLAVRAQAPELQLLFDDEDFERGMDIVRQHQFLGLAISNGQVTEAQVRQAHSEGYWLGIWGVKVQADTRRAVLKGPEFVMTDDLLMLQANLKK